MKAAARMVVERLTGTAVPAGLARTAFATLVDNGLTHSDDGAGPVAAVYLTRGSVVVTSRDFGQAIARCEDPKLELVSRIQLAAEEADPLPGSPAGIPWLARTIATRCQGGRLEFRAGRGRLAFADGVWSCSYAPAVSGFAALAVLPVSWRSST
jgi:hypothetical protein